MSLGKYVLRTFRAAIGKKKKRRRKKKAHKDPAESGGSSMERMSSLSSSESGKKESVVRVVLKSGVVEAYPGVVLACTVIRNHPPGLCLAHPDVFRNPHGAVVRPLEPLFPGQKFLLLPESTVIHLKQKIPESSIGAFAADDDAEEGEQDYSSGTTTASSEEEIGGGGDDDDDGGFMAGCSAREFYVANDRWSQRQFKKLVERGLAVEERSTDKPERNNAKDKKKGKKKKKRRRRRKGETKKRIDRCVAAPAGFRTLRRTWEPSLPSVVEEEEEEEEEEEACFCCQHTKSERPQLRRSRAVTLNYNRCGD